MAQGNDDWKGEHLIRGVKLSGGERMAQARGDGWVVWNMRRKMAGLPHPGAKAHARLMRGVFADAAKTAGKT